MDRGAYSLEVLIVLLCLKLRYHPHVVLLRGNHEEKMMNQQFGFIDEIESRLGSKNGMKLYDGSILSFKPFLLQQELTDVFSVFMVVQVYVVFNHFTLSCFNYVRKI